MYCPISLLGRYTYYFIWPIQGGIQNIPGWCRHLYRSYGSAKHRSEQTKLWILASTAMFCGDCVKTCEDVAPNVGENRPGYLTMTMARLTLPSSPSSFWRNTKCLEHVMFLREYRETNFCGNNILTEGVFVTQPSSNAGISVWRIVWITTNCHFVSFVLF
jgi:hypothetical protein